MAAKILNIESAWCNLSSALFHFISLIVIVLASFNCSAQIEKVVLDKSAEYRIVYERLKNDTTVRQGQYTVYFKQVKVIEGQYEMNQMTGPWRIYHPLSGELKSQGNYSNDVQVGAWNFFFPNGRVKAKKNFDKSKSAEWLSFFKNQSLRSRLIFTNDLLVYALALSSKKDTLIVKTFNYSKEIGANIRTFYPNGFKSASYRSQLPATSRHISLHIANGHPLYTKLLLEDGLNTNLGYKLKGSFRTYHKRGNLREHYIFDSGRLTQVLDMTTKFGTQLNKGSFNEGTGELLQYNTNNELIRKSTYRDGYLDGPFQEFETATEKKHSVLTGEYKNGKPYGKWKKLDAFFKLEYELNFDTDSTVIYQGWYKSGKLELKGHYLNSRMHGQWLGFDIYGDTLTTSNFMHGLKHGVFQDFLLSEMLRSGNYLQGAKSGKWRSYNMSGLSTFEEPYTSISSLDSSLSLDLILPSVMSVTPGSGRFTRTPPQIIGSPIDYLFVDRQRYEVLIAVDRDISGDANFRILFDDNGIIRQITHLSSNKEVFLYYAYNYLINMPILEPTAIDGMPIGDSCNISFFFVPL